MSGCFSPYLPPPSRTWSRAQNQITFGGTYVPTQPVQAPTGGKIILLSELPAQLQMMNKGNVLQYRNNSSQLTRQMRYARVARGKWTNRTTTWATQNTRGYTNPNIGMLKRTGNRVNIAINAASGAVMGETTEPVTCPEQTTPVNSALPTPVSSAASTPASTPASSTASTPPPDNSTVLPPVDDIIADLPIIVSDLGNLICGTQENPCGGPIKVVAKRDSCFLTTASNVPGRAKELCWNGGTTWTPR